MAGDAGHLRVVERADADLVVRPEEAKRRAEAGNVLGISLGAPAAMRFRRRRPGGFDRVSALLRPCSIYHLTGEARHEWEHSIAEIAMTRWSITFSSLSEKGARLAY
jgi:alkylated DNA repair protein (DNA oxidative demethylase)